MTDISRLRDSFLTLRSASSSLSVGAIEQWESEEAALPARTRRSADARMGNTHSGGESIACRPCEALSIDSSFPILLCDLFPLDQTSVYEQPDFHARHRHCELGSVGHQNGHLRTCVCTVLFRNAHAVVCRDRAGVLCCIPVCVSLIAPVDSLLCRLASLGEMLATQSGSLRTAALRVIRIYASVPDFLLTFLKLRLDVFVSR
jgi:hypothetical protein